MKSVVAVKNGKGRGRSSRLRLFALALLVSVAALLSGCSWRHPGETVAEVDRRHERMLRLNSELLLSDLDMVLMLDRPSQLTDKRIP